MSQAELKQEDSPTVAALRKRMRGDAMTEDERGLVRAISSKPPPGTVTFSQEQVSALLGAWRDDAE